MATEIKCPWCEAVAMKAIATNTGIRFLIRCPARACRRKFTVVEHVNKVTRKVDLEVILTRGDREGEKDKLVNMEALTTNQIREELDAREAGLDIYVSSIEEEFNEIRTYLSIRIRKERDEAVARNKVVIAAGEAQARIVKPSKMNDEQSKFRDSCLFFLNRMVAKGKIPTEEAQRYVLRAGTVGGLNELAERLGLDPLN